MTLVRTTAAFDPARLRLARSLRGLQINQLAESIGVTPAAVSQYESGRSKPTSANVAALALALGVGADFFAYRNQIATALDGQPFFRSLRATPKMERRRAHAYAVLAWDLTGLLAQKVRLPERDLPVRPIDETATRSEVETAAAEVREAWGVAPGPVPNVVRLVERHGTIVVRLGLGHTKVDAFSHDFGDRAVIVLTEDKGDAARSRFDAAHELAHVVCHLDAERADGLVERQADAFASALLMPADQIAEELPRRFDLAHLLELKATWGVAVAALLYRSRQLGVLSEPAYRRAVTWMSAQGMRRQEPGPLPSLEQPIMLRKAVELAATVGFGVAELAVTAALPIDVVEMLLGGDTRPGLDL